MRPEETNPLHHTSYRLVGVLLYSHGITPRGPAFKHYIADVLDADEGGWIRYDANSNGAIGKSVEAPTGRVDHENHSYYAILLSYVRVPGNT